MLEWRSIEASVVIALWPDYVAGYVVPVAVAAAAASAAVSAAAASASAAAGMTEVSVQMVTVSSSELLAVLT